MAFNNLVWHSFIIALSPEVQQGPSHLTIISH